MKIAELLSSLELIAPSSLQEPYDNTGLLAGNPEWDCTGIICCLDAIEEVVDEAIQKKCNLVVAHHPIIFKGLKSITGKNYVERTVIKAIKNDIAIYAIHTNLDNTINGVNGRIADKLELVNRSVLLPKENFLNKLITFAPLDKAELVMLALFKAGAGHIGHYSECSFNVEGTGTFTAGVHTNPYVGEKNKMHKEAETRIEVIFPSHLQRIILHALFKTHPYEEVAYDVIPLSNQHPEFGSGLVGQLPRALAEKDFLELVKKIFMTGTVRHTKLTGKPIDKVAVCGGAGSFLISNALKSKVNAFLTADMKYHEFFDADGKLLIADVGHFESEQFTIDFLKEILEQKFPTFAVLKTEVKSNPVHYF